MTPYRGRRDRGTHVPWWALLLPCAGCRTALVRCRSLSCHMWLGSMQPPKHSNNWEAGRVYHIATPPCPSPNIMRYSTTSHCQTKFGITLARTESVLVALPEDASLGRIVHTTRKRDRSGRGRVAQPSAPSRAASRDTICHRKQWPKLRRVQVWVESRHQAHQEHREAREEAEEEEDREVVERVLVRQEVSAHGPSLCANTC